jgi:ADP-heptose:LPS heptosyltransferase
MPRPLKRRRVRGSRNFPQSSTRQPHRLIARKPRLQPSGNLGPVKLGLDRARARDLNWLFTAERILPRAGQHVQDQYFEFREHLGVLYEPPSWDVGPWSAEREWQREFFSGFERPAAVIIVATSTLEKD